VSIKQPKFLKELQVELNQLYLYQVNHKILFWNWNKQSTRTLYN